MLRMLSLSREYANVVDWYSLFPLNQYFYRIKQKTIPLFWPKK